MRFRDESELTDFLDRDMAWRKRELTTLELMVERERSHVQTVVMRGGVCLLYAHWEGFIRGAAQGYVEYVAGRRLRYGELKRNFLVMGVRSRILKAMQQRSTVASAAMVDAILDAGADRMSQSVGNVIDTKSNLDTKIFDEILLTIGFETSGYRSSQLMLDERLLGNRNRIAHGEQLRIDAADYGVLHRTVIGLMNRFKNDIENSVVTRGYRAVAGDVAGPGT